MSFGLGLVGYRQTLSELFKERRVKGELQQLMDPPQWSPLLHPIPRSTTNETGSLFSKYTEIHTYRALKKPIYVDPASKDPSP